MMCIHPPEAASCFFFRSTPEALHLLLGELLSIPKQTFQFGVYCVRMCVERAEESDGGLLLITMESFCVHYTNNNSLSVAAENRPRSMLAFKLKTHARAQTHTHAHTHSLTHLLQFPVEFGGPESIDLGEISPEQEHQAAVVDVQRVMVAVHFWNRKTTATHGHTATQTHMNAKTQVCAKHCIAQQNSALRGEDSDRCSHMVLLCENHFHYYRDSCLVTDFPLALLYNSHMSIS